MDISTLLLLNDLLVLIVLTVGGLLLRSLLPAYFEQKGKDIATKEDIEEITAKTERVKAQFISEVELLRAELSKRSYSHGLVFEKEFELLQEIWAALIEYRDAATLVISPMNTALQEIEDGLVEIMSEKYSVFYQLVENKRPFYTPEIYENLLKIIEYEQVLFDKRMQKAADESLDAVDRKLIDNWIMAIDCLSESIRKRIFENTSPQPPGRVERMTQGKGSSRESLTS